MTNHNQNGAINSVATILILSVLLLVFAIFGIWAYGGRQDYKNNVTTKINAAVKVADNKQAVLDQAQFDAKQKYPLNTYTGPEAYGSFVVMYPKTWSGYVADDGSEQGGAPIIYFNPGMVPSTSAQSSVFALTIQVLSQSYAQTVGGLQQQTGDTVTAYALPKLPSVVGVEVTGSIGSGQNATTGTTVILPLRDNTLELSTDGTQYISDFNNIILKNFSFSP